jgi:hypothetical protein
VPVAAAAASVAAAVSFSAPAAVAAVAAAVAAVDHAWNHRLQSLLLLLRQHSLTLSSASGKQPAAADKH